MPQLVETVHKQPPNHSLSLGVHLRKMGEGLIDVYWEDAGGSKSTDDVRPVPILVNRVPCFPSLRLTAKEPGEQPRELLKKKIHCSAYCSVPGHLNPDPDANPGSSIFLNTDPGPD